MSKKLLHRKEVQQIELNILIAFSNYCKEHNLRFYLAGGTLLGAVRHKGFIPWDDDIDVCMPRSDYEKLLRVFDNSRGNLILKSNQLSNMSAPFTKVIDITTVIESKYQDSDVDTNLWIDIFPIDGLPENYQELSNMYKKINIYRKILMLAHLRLGAGKNFLRKYGKYIIKGLANLYSKQRCINNIEKLASKYPYDECKYVGAVTWGLYGIGERMLKSEFEQAVEVEFEGYKFPTFSCWDSYLKGLYGDYMQLPPIEKRKTHSMVAYKVF